MLEAKNKNKMGQKVKNRLENPRSVPFTNQEIELCQLEQKYKVRKK